jgi:hypothetical protein
MNDKVGQLRQRFDREARWASMQASRLLVLFSERLEHFLHLVAAEQTEKDIYRLSVCHRSVLLFYASGLEAMERRNSVPSAEVAKPTSRLDRDKPF